MRAHALSALLARRARHGAVAQDDRALRARLDKPTLVAVNAIVDSARVAKLPTAPLVDKALEGAAKGSDGAKIVTAVHQLSRADGFGASACSGSNATPDEIKAAAAALEVGVSDRDLARVQRPRGQAARHDAARRAHRSDRTEGAESPRRRISSSSSRESGVKDSDLALFQRNVRADIDRGADPTVAAHDARARPRLQRGATTAKPSSE